MFDFICEKNQERRDVMKKLFSFIKKAPKLVVALVAMLIAAVVVPTALNAWGPDRTLFTAEKPATYVTFNSIKNSPSHGFEPNFVQVKESTASNSTYADSVSLTAGKEYTVYVYYHNNAAANLGLVANDSYAKVKIPAIVPAGSNGTHAVGYVGASNAKPAEVWDDITFKNTSTGDIALRYVPGSAVITNFGKANGTVLPDTIHTTGVALGYDKLDGKVPGCNEYAGYITFKVKADQANFEVTKQVRQVGTTEWKETLNAKKGDTVEYQIEYKNTGTTQQKDVVIKDNLPKGLSYVAGSTTLKNASNPVAKIVSDNLTKDGINVGHYTPGSNAFIRFKATVNEQDLVCGTNSLKNVASAITNNGSKSDDAVVVVNKECKEIVSYTCDALHVKKISDTEYSFTVDYSVSNATFKNVVFTVYGENGVEIDRVVSTSKSAAYTKAISEKSTVEAVITVTVDGVDKTVTSASCKTQLLPPELPKTGSGTIALLGLGTLIASAGYYISSRRALVDAA